MFEKMVKHDMKNAMESEDQLPIVADYVQIVALLIRAMHVCAISVAPIRSTIKKNCQAVVISGNKNKMFNVKEIN